MAKEDPEPEFKFNSIHTAVGGMDFFTTHRTDEETDNWQNSVNHHVAPESAEAAKRVEYTLQAEQQESDTSEF